jgi:hypothetical protein
LTAVAPIVRFNALEILATPVFFFASDFNSRTSDEVHARLTTVFFFGISAPVDENGLLARREHLAIQSKSIGELSFGKEPASCQFRATKDGSE